MMKWIISQIRYLLSEILNFNYEAYKIPSLLMNLILFQRSLVNISYLRDYKYNQYIYVISLFARPQLYFSLPQLGYIIIALNCCYFIAITVKFKGRRFLSTYGEMMKSNLLNFSIEISKGPINYICQISTILISFIQQIIIGSTLDVEVKNFSQTQITFLDYIIWILNVLQSLLWYYNLNWIALYCVNILCILASLRNSKNSINSAIQLHTLFIYILQLFEIVYELSGSIILFPMFLRLQQRYTQFTKITNSNNSQHYLINISQLIKDKQFYKALQQLQQLQYRKRRFNLIMEAKINLMMKKCLNQININIQSNSHPQSTIINIINSIMETEERYNSITIKLKEFIEIKIKLLQTINNPILQNFLEFLEEVQNLKQNIELQFSVYPTQKYKSLLIFLNSEILNNFHECRLLVDSKEGLKHDEYELSKLTYIISLYQNGLKIKGFSKNQILNGDLSESINQLIPPGIKEWHELLVQQFITTGTSKYYQRLEENFISKQNDKLMIAVDFGMTVCITNEFKFITFLQPTIEQPMAIILNSLQQIMCISEHLFNSISITPFSYRDYGHHIKKFIPQFSDTIEYQENLEIYLSDQESDSVYITSINQKSKLLEGQIIYYVLRFEFIRKLGSKGRSSNSLTQLHSQIGETTYLEGRIRSDFDLEQNIQLNIPDEEIIQHPYDDESEHNQFYSDAIQLYEDNTNIYSPNKEQSRQKLIRKHSAYTYTNTKIKKQNSQILEQEDAKANLLLQKSEENIIPKDFLYDYYNQDINVIKKFIILLTISLLIVFILSLVLTLKVNENLSQLVIDIEVLDFAQFSFQPLESNLLTVFELSEYVLMYQLKLISYQQLTELVIFPSENMYLGYDQIYSNFNALFQSPLLQEILDDNYLIVYQYTNSSILETYNLSIRNAFQTLLSFQYDGLLDFQKNGKLNADSSYIYYTFKNYLPLKSIVSTLNSDLLIQTIELSNQDLNQITITLIIAIISFIIPYSISYYYFLLIQQQFERYFNVIQQLSNEQKEIEILHYKHLLLKLNEDCEYILKYRYYENQQNKQINIQKKQKIVNKFKVSLFQWKLSYLILLIIIFTKAAITYYFTYNYLEGYSEIATFYKSLSDLSIDINTIYAAREVIYFKTSFPYLDDETIKELINQIQEALERTDYFQKHNFETNKAILSQQFQDYYDSIGKGDLCSFLSVDLQTRTKSFCSKLLNGNMSTGLLAVLTIIMNNIKNEMSVNCLSTRLSMQIYDLEGPYLVSQLVSNLFIMMRDDLLNETNKLLNTMNILNILLLVLIGIIVILSKWLIFDNIVKKIFIFKQFIIFIPIQTLLYDEQVERFIRNIIYRNK